VKIEQGKVNDQANTLAELAKVSITRTGREEWASRDTGIVSNQRRQKPTMQHQVFMLNLALQFKFMSNIPGIHSQGSSSFRG
jgi:hypothetical protein